jgi:DNA-binding transcriptional MocR family regulator
MTSTTQSASDGAAAPPAGTTRAEALAQRLAARIGTRQLAPGARLPSVRDCAAREGLSPSTVVAAYDLLQARGLVLARPQRGFFVREALPPAGLADVTRAVEPAGRRRGDSGTGEPVHGESSDPGPVDATALVRSMFHPARRRGAGGPGMGTLPPAWLDAELLQRLLRKASAGPAAAEAWLHYGDPAGDPVLREALVPQLAAMGIPARPAQIVTTLGATQGLDIVARSLLAPGDAVLVDEPGWAVEFARLERLGLEVLPVPRGADGPDLDRLAALAAAHRPRVYVTMSVLHNPTGTSFSAATAHRVLKLAEALDLVLVEDDTYAAFAPPGATRLAQLDGLSARSVYVSGFAKLLAPQWRVGFIAAPPALAERFIDTKMLAGLTTPASFERAVGLGLASGALRRHSERLAARLAAARQRSARLVREAGCDFVTPPQGLFGWIDTHTDTEALAPALLAEGWLTVPGTLFHARRSGEPAPPRTLMRINFAAAQDARFWQRLVALRGR